jgi:serine/threonine protein kinase
MIGQTIKDRYAIISMLGEGGMGEVYLATDQLTGQQVAVKILAIHLRANSEMLQRFQREAKTLRQLDHPNIVKFVDAFEHEGQFVIVMEYVSGGSLHDLLKQGPLPIERARKIALGLCDALIRSHQLNIIHRDIKPENVLLAEDGSARLTDFGVARLSEGTRMTRSGTQVGTPYYMAPEAWEGRTLDAQADIWSLGVILFEMLTGQVPFGGDTPLAVMSRVHTASLPDLRKLRPDAQPKLVKITRRMVTRDKQKRYQTMREVAVDLEREQSMKSREGRPADPIVTTRRKRPLSNYRLFGLMIGGSVIIAAAGANLLFSTNRLSLPSGVTPGLIPTTNAALPEAATNYPTATSTRSPTQTPSATPTPIYVEGTVLLVEDFQNRDLGRIFGWNFSSNILGISNPGQYWNVEEESDGNRLLFGAVPETDETGFGFGSIAWSNYVFQFRAKVIQRGSDVNSQGFGITVRGSTDQGCPLGYEMGLGKFWFLGLSSGPRSTNGNCQFRHLVDAPQKGILTDHWYVIRAEVYDSSIHLFVDDALVHKLTNDQSPNGSVGILISNGAQVYFDDIGVLELVAR